MLSKQIKEFLDNVLLVLVRSCIKALDPLSIHVQISTLTQGLMTVFVFVSYFGRKDVVAVMYSFRVVHYTATWRRIMDPNE